MLTVAERLIAVEVHLDTQGKQLGDIGKKVDDLHAYILLEKGAKSEKRRALNFGHMVSVGVGAVVGGITAVVAVANRFYPIGTH